MRIQVIFTGGTIGSSIDSSAVISTSTAAAGRLLLDCFYKNAAPARRDEVVFDVEEPYSCLSEDLTVEHWNRLVEALRRVDFSAVDGVIVTHGTDTLAYTAALLSQVLAGVKKPVVVLGSNYVLTDPRADGNANFAAAVEWIARGDCPGVFAISCGRVLLGSRVLQCRPFTDDFTSVNGVDFARVTGGEIALVPHPQNPTPAQLQALASGEGQPLLYTLPPLEANVLYLRPYVGLDYRDILPDRDIRAVLHGLYHSSTARVGDVQKPDASSILTLCRACNERGIALFIAPFKEAMLADGARYETTDQLLHYGVAMACDMAEQMAYIKLLCAAALYPGQAAAMERFVNTNIFFEKLV